MARERKRERERVGETGIERKEERCLMEEKRALACLVFWRLQQTWNGHDGLETEENEFERSHSFRLT